ncbi:formyltransferase family protein [Jannaschia rubra]|uniref:phosphoribosylglycinamide formyltransferase 1 n=1 Tax=Jannaschia rubra TaxID=282197 RepID=A0A0M6XR77_9RHOB|nr:formyltransferase family protein [Jannaschia rubra]CTQ32723.1 Phosphoribosylglycinamide formyltransferase [Jannaschia rubra]SFF88273.1 Formyl transferase [Jannaschia rubra]
MTGAPSGVALITFDTAYGHHMAQRLSQALADGDDPLRAILAVRTKTPKPAQRRVPGLHRLRRLVSLRDRMAHRAWQLQRRADAAFARAAGPVPAWPSGCALRPCSRGQVNDAATLRWMRERNVRLLVLAGAPILRAPMIGIAPLGVLNVHSSLLPHYRGTRAEFWQVHNGDTDRAGLTVHFVDTGVDSGDIVLQVPQRAAPGDDPWLMRSRNQLNALDALPRAVRAVLAGTATRRPQIPTRERAYRFSDITPQATRRVIARVRR